MSIPAKYVRLLRLERLLIPLFLIAGCQESPGPPVTTSADKSATVHSAEDLATKPIAQPPAEVIARFQPIRDRIAKTKQLTSEDVATLEALARQAPGYAPISNLLGQVYVQREDWNGLASLMLAQPRDRWDEAHRIQMANVLIRAQRFREALDAVQPIVDDAKMPNTEAAWNAGYAAFHLGELTTARQILAANLDQLVAADHLDAYLLIADIDFRDGKLPEAATMLGSLLERNDQHAPGHDLLGRILSVQGNSDEARRHIEQAAAIRAENTESEQKALRLAAASQALNAAFERKDYEACEAYIREMLPQVNRQQQSELWKYVAAIRRAQGRPEEAQKALQRAAQLTESQ